MVAVGATVGKNAAVAVRFFDQERDRRSLMNDFIYLASSANKRIKSCSLAVTFASSTLNVEREIMCDSDQDDGDARSVYTLLLTSVRTSEEGSLEIENCSIDGQSGSE